MLDLIIKGIATGFILSILLGPVFFLLLETSIRKGIRAAIALDIGVFVSDIIYVTFAYFFYHKVSGFIHGKNAYIFQIVGGLVFIGFGVVNLIKKPKHDKKSEDEIINSKSKDYAVLALKGFVLNFANPGVIIYWLGVISLGVKGDGEGTIDDSIIPYLSIILITFFSMDILKIVGAKKLRPFITDNRLNSLNKLTGIVIAGSGIYLFIKGIITYYNAFM